MRTFCKLITFNYYSNAFRCLSTSPSGSSWPFSFSTSFRTSTHRFQDHNFPQSPHFITVQATWSMMYGVYNVDFFMFMSCYFYPRYIGKGPRNHMKASNFLELYNGSPRNKFPAKKERRTPWHHQIDNNSTDTLLARVTKLFNNWNTQCWSNITAWKVVVAVAWRERERRRATPNGALSP